MSIFLIVLACAVLMASYEAVVPGRKWPQVAGWWLRAALLNLVQVGSVFMAAHLWDNWMLRTRSYDLEWTGHWGTLFGYLVITFLYYWWHRFRHHSDFLWRAFHQVHHSPRRIEVITSFYKHPFEIVANAFLSSAILYRLCGLGDVQAATAVLITGVAELVYHWNVKTPYWLGYVFQRPESHCVHHQEGLHSYNYADLPLWDMLFGTFRNPREWSASCGFGAEPEQRLGAMLRGVDVAPKQAVKEGR